MPAASVDIEPTKLSQPKITIRTFKLLDHVKQVSTFGSVQRMMTMASDRGLTPNPDQRRSESEVPTSDPDRLEADQRNKSILEEKTSKLVRFGPTYGKDTEANQKAKDLSWEHIIQEKNGGNEVESSYMKLLKDIEKDVIECYDDNIAKNLKRGVEFRKMMARDGCFFLQVTLHILGGGDLLGYPEQNPYFGKDGNPASWIPDVFFAGNQIPYIVIKALMEQPFFQGVIKKGIEKDTWNRPAVEDSAKLALYLTVVEPYLEKKKPNKFILGRQTPLDSSQEPPSDVLQALHRLLVGSRSDNDPAYSEMKMFHDLEAGTLGKDVAIPSAGELYKLGIKLVKGKTGITNIRFENFGYSAFLYVPPFTVGPHTEQLLTSLANHELSLNESERELTAYLRFMRDLAPTYKDFKILEKKGIIRVEDERLKGTMVYMLDALVSQHGSSFTLNFRQIKRRIKDYGGPPWRLISFSLGVLAVVQTIFTVLSYVIPRD